MESTQKLVTVIYEGEAIEVTREVADFLDNSRKEKEKADRSDRRHLTSKNLEENFFEDDIADECVNIEADFIRREDYRQLYAAIDALPDLQRKRIKAHYFEGLTYRQIGERERIDHRAIVRSVESALGKLKNFFE
jgi:RNA polymerase sigma-70 factor (ECF subfamily)